MPWQPQIRLSKIKAVISFDTHPDTHTFTQRNLSAVDGVMKKQKQVFSERLLRMKL